MTDSFDALYQQVDALFWSVQKHEGLYSRIRKARSLIGTDSQKFTHATKTEIAESLQEAEECLGALCATADLEAAITQAKNLLAEAEPHVPIHRARSEN